MYIAALSRRILREVLRGGSDDTPQKPLPEETVDPARNKADEKRPLLGRGITCALGTLWKG